MTSPLPDGAAAARARRPRHVLSFQARLVITIVGIVSVILLLITTLTSVFLTGVLDARLSDQVKDAIENIRTDEEAAAASGMTAAEILGSRPRDAGTLLIIQSPTDSLSGAVVESDHDVVALTTDQLSAFVTDFQALATGAGTTDSYTIRIDGIGDFRIRGLVDQNKTFFIVGLSTDDVQSTVGKLWQTVVLATVGGMFLLGVATSLVIRAGLKPLRTVAATATRVSRQQLDQGDVEISERVPSAQADPRTEIGQVGAALNTLLDHVETSLDARQRNEEMMRRFVADASHELRTPLASIRGYSELSLRDPALSETTEQSLERIQAQSLRMTSLVEDLLLLARLDEGQELVLGAVDLTELSVEAIADQQMADQQMPGASHHWAVEVPEDPVVIAGDRARLIQVVTNLLANARTHTPGGTSVELGLRLDGTGGATRAVLTVHDDGPGIDETIQDQLFTRFVRADRSRARKTGGTGLGLSIAKAIVEAHHGEISVRSTPGDTTFEVRLPARPATSA